MRRRDSLAMLLVWLACLCLALFVTPLHYEITIGQLVYYSVYNVAVGALVGLYLFDRVPRDGWALFALQAASALLLGTLMNEAVVEPFMFKSEPINGEGVYYGLTEAISVAGLFLLIRMIQQLHLHTQRDRSPDTSSDPSPNQDSRTPIGAEASCLIVRVGDSTRRIKGRDVLYMEAERDFTRIVCANEEHFVSESLKSLANRSVELGIFRVHKSFAVNLERVERLTRTEVQLAGHRIPVGRRYSEAIPETWLVRPAQLNAH